MPEAESLLAAVVAEPDLYEGLRYRLREDITVIDELAARCPAWLPPESSSRRTSWRCSCVCRGSSRTAVATS